MAEGPGKDIYGDGIGGRDGMKKDEDEEEIELSPFHGVDKATVLQESRAFHDPQYDPYYCSQIITKLLYLIHQGDSFSKVEATEVFFAVTKLFQSTNVNLRRMVYLIIKEISPSSDDVIIVTSSLIRDMTGKTEVYHANAIRVLCRILSLDANSSSLLAQIGRHFKEAIVDKSSVVASAALVSGIHLLDNNSDIVRRWTNEIQEALQSKVALVQFHALALLHRVRQSDRQAVSKLVTTLTRGAVRSPLAQCLLIRYTAQVMADMQPAPNGDRAFYDYLDGCLRNKSEMVIFEAARAITEMKGVTTRELSPAITVLQLFLSSTKPVMRFAAVRTLNKVAMQHPLPVANCNMDLEGLITDPNRSIATLALTTLLKTGNENGVDRLLKQITTFMSDIADEFKVVVVEAIRSLCLKFPGKYRTLMNFLSNILREEGGFDYKKAIVDSLLQLIRDIPEAKEAGLMHLCEFIEDCEFTYLSTQILNLLGKEAPLTSDPSKYIRYIYNRVILENANVRASAVSALANFGAKVEGLRFRIQTLLKRCLFDSDDEVRDRATFYLRLLEGNDEGDNEPGWGTKYLTTTQKYPLAALENTLREYLAGDKAERFDSASIPTTHDFSIVADAGQDGLSFGGMGTSASPVIENRYAELLAEVPELANLGALFKSTAPVQLTELETEYNVSCVKHIFPDHIVFQFNCTNTVKEQQLADVQVAMETDAEGFEEESVIPLPVAPLEGSEPVFVVMARTEGAIVMGGFQNTLKFSVSEIDPATGEPEEEGFEDEYELEDIEVTIQDYIQARNVPNFRHAWEQLGEDTEREDEYGLGKRDSLEEAVDAVIKILGMCPCESSDVVPPDSRSHTSALAGVFVGGYQALVKAQFGIDSSRNIALRLTVRSDSVEISELVHDIIGSA